MVSSSRQQLEDLRTLGRGHDLFSNPRGLALRFMRHDGLLGAPDHDDVLSDAMWGIARALETWDDSRGVALSSWCWWKMRSEVAHGRRHRARFRPELLVDWAELAEPGAAERAEGQGRRSPIPDIEWLRVDLVEHGYKQVEDRATLQRWADMAHLTDSQADLLAWFAVHEGTILRHTQFRGERCPITGRSSVLNSGLARLRRVAVTGRPFVRVVPAPTYSLDDVRAAVAG